MLVLFINLTRSHHWEEQGLKAQLALVLQLGDTWQLPSLSSWILSLSISVSSCLSLTAGPERPWWWEIRWGALGIASCTQVRMAVWWEVMGRS